MSTAACALVLTVPMVERWGLRSSRALIGVRKVGRLLKQKSNFFISLALGITVHHGGWARELGPWEALRGVRSSEGRSLGRMSLKSAPKVIL